MVKNNVVHSIIDQRPKQYFFSCSELLDLSQVTPVVLEAKLHIVRAFVHHDGQHGAVDISWAELNITHVESPAGRGQLTEVQIVVLRGINVALV